MADTENNLRAAERAQLAPHARRANLGLDVVERFDDGCGPAKAGHHIGTVCHIGTGPCGVRRIGLAKARRYIIGAITPGRIATETSHSHVCEIPQMIGNLS
ncbi:MAG: hypothetical protein Q8O42_08970 [Acidobacteriota bacterium]|nr:hypothetical protein [Acidobacteriota bacterium]